MHTFYEIDGLLSITFWIYRSNDVDGFEFNGTVLSVLTASIIRAQYFFSFLLFSFLSDAKRLAAFDFSVCCASVHDAHTIIEMDMCASTGKADVVGYENALRI